MARSGKGWQLPKVITEEMLAKLYSSPKAASYLGYSEGGLRKLVSLKKLHPTKVGHELRFFKSDLDYFNKHLRRPRGRPLRPAKYKMSEEERERTRLRVAQYRKKLRAKKKKAQKKNAQRKRAAKK